MEEFSSLKLEENECKGKAQYECTHAKGDMKITPKKYRK